MFVFCSIAVKAISASESYALDETLGDGGRDIVFTYRRCTRQMTVLCL